MKRGTPLPTTALSNVS